MFDSKHRYSLPQEILTSLDDCDDIAGLDEIWKLASTVRTTTHDAWIQRAGAQIRGNLNHITRSRAKIRWLRVSYAIAASIAVLVAVGISLQPSGTAITVPNGSQLRHVLPDGSVLQLNSGSSITFDDRFDEGLRQVRLLHGEVHFSVSESDIPFQVLTPQGTVEVLGTSFNVRAWPEDAFADVVVTSGSVRVTPAGGVTTSVVLTAGEATRIAAGLAPRPLGPGYTEQASSWQSGSFKFSDHPLGLVIREVERRYNISVQTPSTMDLDERVGILVEQPEGPSEILRDLCELKGCEPRVVPDGFAITYEVE